MKKLKEIINFEKYLKSLKTKRNNKFGAGGQNTRGTIKRQAEENPGYSSIDIIDTYIRKLNGYLQLSSQNDINNFNILDTYKEDCIKKLKDNNYKNKIDFFNKTSLKGYTELFYKVLNEYKITNDKIFFLENNSDYLILTNDYEDEIRNGILKSWRTGDYCFDNLKVLFNDIIVFFEKEGDFNKLPEEIDTTNKEEEKKQKIQDELIEAYNNANLSEEEVLNIINNKKTDVESNTIKEKYSIYRKKLKNFIDEGSNNKLLWKDLSDFYRTNLMSEDNASKLYDIDIKKIKNKKKKTDEERKLLVRF